MVAARILNDWLEYVLGEKPERWRTSFKWFWNQRCEHGQSIIVVAVVQRGKEAQQYWKASTLQWRRFNCCDSAGEYVCSEWLMEMCVSSGRASLLRQWCRGRKRLGEASLLLQRCSDSQYWSVMRAPAGWLNTVASDMWR